MCGLGGRVRASYFTPPLTTVRQDFLAVGRHAIELLLDEMALVSEKPTKIVVPPVLVPRYSSAVRRESLT
ncbi:MAG TPA: substrate-binding domain-containing protein [Dehalococcoidia bacterium]|nr:substrate-binding domain-containing protein [Dehalococcoidia bacterium]